MPWQPLPLSYAIAIYPFQPSSSPAELPLQVGDQLYVVEQGGKDGSWCRGYLMAPPTLLSSLSSNGKSADARVFSGIFPRSCIDIREELGDEAAAKAVVAQPGSKPPAPVPMLKVGDESPSSSSEPLVDEIASCLREWYVSHLPDLVLKRQYDVLDKMSSITTRLDFARRELLNNVLTSQERLKVQEDAVWDLVRGNKMLGGDIIVRDPKQQGRLLTGEDSAVDVAKLQSVMSLLDESPVENSQVTRLHHCLLEVRSAVGTGLDSAYVSVMLYQRAESKAFRQISETCTAPASDRLRTLLADLSKRDFSDDGFLYLVVRIFVNEEPRTAPQAYADEPYSRDTTPRGTRMSLLERKRSSLVFGSKRNKDKDKPGSGENGRVMAPSKDRVVSPSIPEEGLDEDTTLPKPHVNPVPRTIGVGMIDIASYLRAGKDESVEIPIRAPIVQDEEFAESGSTFLQQLLPSASGLYTNCQRVSSVKIDLKTFQATDADTLIRMNPTSMHQISKTQRIGFSEAPTKHRSDIYLTLNRADIFQGAQLSHPELGSVPIRATTLPNLQLTMELRDGTGKRLEHSIFASSNGPGVTALRTQAVEAGLPWNQTICIRIPQYKVIETHLVLSVADAPEFPFALAWMPLWDKSTFMQDGKHSLALHAYDKTTSTFSHTGQGAYLSLPWDCNKVRASAGHDGVPINIAALEIETRLCSTELSQDPILASLFNWKMLSSPRLMEMLTKLFFVPELEIAKQLNEVLDALFAILEHKSGSTKFEDMLFNNIVFVLGILHDRRFNLGPVVDRYVVSHFKAPPIEVCLVRSWLRLLQNVTDAQSSRNLRALFKVGKQFMKLLMRSYAKHASSTDPAEQKPQTFKEDMQAVLFGLQMMMRNDTAALVGNKTLLVQNFHSWIPELLAVYSIEEVVRIAVNFVDSCEEVTGKLVLHKLILIQNYTRLSLIWDEPKHRKTLVKHTLRWLYMHWGVPQAITTDWREEIRLCCSIVAELAKHPTPHMRDFLPAVVATYCTLGTESIPRKRSLSLLFPSTYPFIVKPVTQEDYFDEALLELSALLSALVRIEAPTSSRKSGQPSAEHLHNVLNMTKSLLSGKVFPASWLSLHTHYHYSAVDILSWTSNQLTTFFLPEPEQAEGFDMELWKSFFETTLLLVASPTLTLESFSEQKRRAVWKIAGDVRQAGAEILKHFWNVLGWEATADDERRYGVQRLGGYQVQYVPSLVGPVIELCLSMHEGLRRAAVGILQTMIISEWGLNEDLDLIETEVVGALNSLLKPKDDPILLGNNDAVKRKLFVGELLELFGTISKQPDDALWTALEDLVTTIEELIDLLSASDEVDSRDRARHQPRSGTAEGKRSTELPDRSISRMEGKVYGKEALEVYKQLADEYEANGDYKRLARTYRAIARIHEARTANRVTEDLNGDIGLEDMEEEDEADLDDE